MLEELKNLNIKDLSGPETVRHFHISLGKIRQLLTEEKLFYQKSLRHISDLEKELASISTTLTSEKTWVEIPEKAEACEIDPQPLNETEKEQYDVILDIPSNVLLARTNPQSHTPLYLCPVKNLGATRMKLLRYMLEHPGFPICIETIDNVYPTASLIESALAASIMQIRKCIQKGNPKGPYIITERTFGESVSHTGSVYRADPQWKYLVIKFFTKS